MRALALLVAMACSGTAVASASPGPQGSDDYGGFHNVLAAGQGQTATAIDVAAAQGGAAPPASFTSQVGLYDRLIALAPDVSAQTLGQAFKSGEFGVAPGDVAATETPRAGVEILIDRSYGIPHVYGQSRADVMFGAGYASAQDRLFLMDVLRHTARGTLSELIGAGPGNSTVAMDAQQLKFADYDEQELQGQIAAGTAAYGAEGQQVVADSQAYTDGVNESIHEALLDPSKMPGEYAALGQLPADWKITDSIAVASLINEQQGSGGGAQDRLSRLRSALEQRFGPPAAARVFADLRERDDPDAPATTTTRFPFWDAGPINPASVAPPDPGSYKSRNPVVAGAGGSATGASARTDTAWLAGLQRRGLPVTRHDSNATLITAARSASGRPLMVAGPQVGYYSPEILLELDLHGGGIDAEGASFPGISQYVLLGHGRDFAWSATSAGSEQEYLFAERLCNPDGSAPTTASDHYFYRDACVPLVQRDQVLHTGPSAANPTDPAQTITLRIQRSVHGPIQGYATVGGRPVAIALARSTYFHEADAAIAFARLNEGTVSDAASFRRAIGYINSSFNWFYVDDRDGAYQLSGDYPRTAPGTDPDLPTWGTGEWDWQGFDTARYSSDRMSADALPHDVNPARGYLISWNNKPAPGWRAASDTLVWGSVFRSQLLERRVQAALAGGARVTLAQLVGIMGDAATSDLRGQELYPWLRRVVGDPGDPRLRQLLGLLDAWSAGGSHRRDRGGSGYYEEGAAVALMDAWWQRLAPAVLEPALGGPVLDALGKLVSINDPPGPQGDAFYGGFYSYVQKDLRDLLARSGRAGARAAAVQRRGGRRPAARRRHRRPHRARRVAAGVSAPYSRVYCGGGSLPACRAVLVSTLQQAVADVAKRYGSDDPARWRVPVTCTPGMTPPACDQIEFTTAGAIATPPIPWQNRGTFQQAVEVQGHRPR